VSPQKRVIDFWHGVVDGDHPIPHGDAVLIPGVAGPDAISTDGAEMERSGCARNDRGPKRPSSTPSGKPHHASAPPASHGDAFGGRRLAVCTD